METAQNVMQMFDPEAQKEYQTLEHAEQLKIAEQKRVEQAKIKVVQAAKTVREARIAAAREEARIRAEKDTRLPMRWKRKRSYFL